MIKTPRFRSVASSLLLVVLSGCLDTSMLRGLLQPATVPQASAPQSNGSNQSQSSGTGNSSANRNPTIISFTANPTNLTTPGGTITFQLDTVDLDGDVLSFNWSATGGTISATNSRVVSWKPPVDAGTYTITVSVSDGRGGSASSNQNITVRADGSAAVNDQGPTTTPASDAPAPAPTQAPVQQTPAPANSSLAWSQIQLPVSINSATFPSANEVWAVGTDSRILHTVDAGLNWTTITKGSQALYAINAVGGNVWVAGDNGTVFRTQDSGQNWELIDAQVSGSIRQIRFVDASTGYLVASGNNVIADPSTVYKTTDGGSTWQLQQLRSNPPRGLSRIIPTTSGVVWCQDGMGILRSNFGAWEEVSLPTGTIYGGSSGFLSFSDDGRYGAMLGGPSGALSITSDAGATWTEKTKFTLQDEIVRLTGYGVVTGLDEINSGSVLIGQSGELLLTLTGRDDTLVSTNHGSTWTKIAKSPNSLVAGSGRFFAPGRAWLYRSGNNTLYRLGT